jgi:uncharacterized protein (TIGR02246 family)
MRQLAAVAMIGVVALLGSAWSQPPSSPVQSSGSPPGDEAVRNVIAGTAEAFDVAYNAHDADAVANLFAENAEFLDDGGLISGRDAIRAAFIEIFTESPEATLETVVEDVRLPTPNMAIEEGRTYASHGLGKPGVERRYVVIHTRQGNDWKIASVREEPHASAVTPAEALEPLAWLVGDWIDESDDQTVQTSCRWSEDGNWLLQDFTVQLHGGPEMTGTQRIGWDPSRRQVRSWTFDSEGGVVEGAWTFDGERWTVQVSGYAADGRTGTATRVIAPLGPDGYVLRSFHRVLDGEPLPDSEVAIVRIPPAPEENGTDPVPADGAAAPQN